MSNRSVGDPMATYLFYFLGRDGEILRGVSAECADDAQAIERAAGMKHVRRIEIRRDNRWIATVPPQRGWRRRRAQSD
jgi:hypothetical protein